MKPLVIEGETARMLIAQMTPYKKRGSTLMVQIHEDFVLGPGVSGIISGEISAAAGSWLAHDPSTGAFWPVSPGYHDRHYEPEGEP